MTVRLETTLRRYIGLSTDEKPELEPKDAGSSFMEEDTGLIARWDGRTWSSPVAEVASAAQLIVEAQRTNELLEMLLEKF